MALSDYAHWNEEAPRIWWEEEGKHYDSDYESAREDDYSAADAFAEELGEYEDEALIALYEDKAYLFRWPKARLLIEWELKHRGLPVPEPTPEEQRRIATKSWVNAVTRGETELSFADWWHNVGSRV